jgi:hypothetical protein
MHCRDVVCHQLTHLNSGGPGMAAERTAGTETHSRSQRAGARPSHGPSSFPLRYQVMPLKRRRRPAGASARTKRKRTTARAAPPREPVSDDDVEVQVSEAGGTTGGGDDDIKSPTSASASSTLALPPARMPALLLPAPPARVPAQSTSSTASPEPELSPPPARAERAQLLTRGTSAASAASATGDHVRTGPIIISLLDPQQQQQQQRHRALMQRGARVHWHSNNNRSPRSAANTNRDTSPQSGSSHMSLPPLLTGALLGCHAPESTALTSIVGMSALA